MGGGDVGTLLQDLAYTRIKERIQNGTYPAGGFLSERKLARDLGMSKTPIRAALTRLNLEGFVAISPRQGIVVREPSLRETVDLFDLRVALESFVARALAGRLSPPQAERLRKNLRTQEERARAGDLEELTRLDTEFHLLLCEFLDNREILRAMSGLRDKLHRVILHVMKAEGRPLEACREHAAVAEALLKGNGDQAARRLIEHLEFGKKYLVSR